MSRWVWSGRGEKTMVRGWRYVVTLGDVLELSAAWIEGQTPFHPHFGGRRGQHIVNLAPSLAGATRAGWLIQGYQTGLRSIEAQQRAYIEGYCHRDLSTWIRNAGLDLALTVEVRNPGFVVRPTTDITRSGSRVLGRVGGRPHPEELMIYASAGVPTRLVDDIAGLPYVTVVDPEWDRTDRIATLLSRIAETFGDRYNAPEDDDRLIDHRSRSDDHWVASHHPEPVIPTRRARHDAAGGGSLWRVEGWGQAG